MTTTAHFDQLQLACRCCLSTTPLERWPTNGTGPNYIRLHGKVIYRLCDIEANENKCLVSSTAEFYKSRRNMIADNLKYSTEQNHRQA